MWLNPCKIYSNKPYKPLKVESSFAIGFSVSYVCVWGGRGGVRFIKTSCLRLPLIISYSKIEYTIKSFEVYYGALQRSRELPNPTTLVETRNRRSMILDIKLFTSTRFGFTCRSLASWFESSGTIELSLLSHPQTSFWLYYPRISLPDLYYPPISLTDLVGSSQVDPLQFFGWPLL